MGRKRQMRLTFPLGGLDRRASARQQRPYTTPDCLNVRPTGTLESRERGGSRPGLVQSHQDDLGSNVRFLIPMILAMGDDKTAWSDTFGGSAMAGVWGQASWATDSPSILTQMASVDTSVADAASVRDALTIDASAAYTVEALLIPWNGAFHGDYKLYLRLDNATPAFETDGVEVSVTMTGTGGVYTGTATSYVGGVADATGAGSPYTMTGGTLSGSAARPVWLIATVSADTITVTLDGAQILSQAMDGAQNGLRVGFGMEATVASGVCLMDVFRVQYTSTGTVEPLSSMLAASAGGNIYNETTYGRMTVVTSDLTVRDDVSLEAVQSGQKLYVADFGDLRATAGDGVVNGATLDSATYAAWDTLGILTDDDVCVISSPSGSAGTFKIQSVAEDVITLTASPGDNSGVSFRIERAPKVYDPVAETIAIMTATDDGDGQVPIGCPLVTRYLDRIVLAGAEIAPGVWYMARRSDELDWDYSQTDDERAVAGTASAAGVPAKAITALAPASDDYLIIGCRDSLWRMRGDPALGGSLDALSHTIGIVDAGAWCWGPAAEFIFLSLDGIYILPPGGEASPVSMSRELLPRELLNFDPDTSTINLEYDVQFRGVHIFLTPDSTDQRRHWWMNWEGKTFWPITLTSDHEPMATCNLQAIAIEDSGVIIGGRDGKLRKFSGNAANDCGTAFSNYMFIGPIPLAADGYVGRLLSMNAVVAEDSGDVTWNLYPALTFEATYTASSADTGTWVAGLNGTDHPVAGGQAYLLEITGTANYRWALEGIETVIMDAGPRRIA